MRSSWQGRFVEQTATEERSAQLVKPRATIAASRSIDEAVVATE